MPSLRDAQRALRSALVDGDPAPACAMIAAGGAAPEHRLDVYRQGFASTLTRALRLAFPAVHRLVGDDCFDGAAWRFVHAHPPRSAWLDEYGDEFPAFLARFAPTAALAWLADVAHLEFAVVRALHAPDALPLDPRALARLSVEERARIAFVPNPAVRVLSCAHPADEIWRAVLARDDAALAALDPRRAPVELLVDRGPAGVGVTRLDPAVARFTTRLLQGASLEHAIATAGDADAAAVLADHLHAGRFVDFRLREAADDDAALRRAA
jgi:hypothetical protein